jgi:geranylgeranyl reductase family protein
LEKAEHPRYKTCGGGLIGGSLSALPAGVEVPARDLIDRATFTRDGRREFTRESGSGPLVTMVRREEFDSALCRASIAAGAQVRQRATVRAIEQDDRGQDDRGQNDGGQHNSGRHNSGRHDGEVLVRLAGGEELTARVVVGADGSSGFTSRYVGVSHDQVDLGLEVELPVTGVLRDRWRGRLLIDWGPVPGSYGWVFPKDDRLTVGVIAGRGQGEQTKRYLRDFVARLGLSDLEPEQDSGHLTRCRSEDSPLRRGRVLVAGDAAGLLEPWTREGISYALSSGALAGAHAAADDLDGYVSAVHQRLGPSMRAGRRLMRAFTAHPGVFHSLLATPAGWQAFARFCRGELFFDSVVDRLPVRAALRLLAAGAPATVR